jgi:hypothetical protein
MANNSKTEVIYDAKATIKALNAINPEFKKQMVREFKFEAKPMVESLSKRIKELAPPVGSLNHEGRTNWGAGKYKNNSIKPDNVLARFTTGRSRRVAVTSLFAVWVRSPMVAVTAVIGKGSMSPKRAVTREYDWKSGSRTHRNNGQGQKLLSFVRDHNEENWFFKEVEKTLPDVEQKVKLVWDRYSRIASGKLK